MSLIKQTSLLKKSTDGFLGMRKSMICCHIPANGTHMTEFSAVFNISKALQYSFSTG
jgi:hypothetical protein